MNDKPSEPLKFAWEYKESRRHREAGANPPPGLGWELVQTKGPDVNGFVVDVWRRRR